jgi:hypothetical protein
MALSSTQQNFYVTVSSATQSDHLSLPPNASGARWVLTFTSAGAFALDVQYSNDGGTTWTDLYDINNNKVTINTATPTYQALDVGAGQYRMDVDTYNNPITMRATEA